MPTATSGHATHGRTSSRPGNVRRAGSIRFGLFVFLAFLLIVLCRSASVSADTTATAAQQQTIPPALAKNVQNAEDPVASASGWITDVVATHAAGSSLAIDATGRIGIGYSGFAGLQIARPQTGQWLTSTVPYPKVEFGAVSAALTALSFDPQNRGHLAYGSATEVTQQAYYSVEDVTTGWTSPMLLNPYSASPNSISVATDQYGFARISYCAQTGQTGALELWYVQMMIGDYIWTKGPLEHEGCWYATSVVVDSDNAPHIAYYSTATGSNQGVLKYATMVDGEWEFETVDDTGNAGRSLSMAMTHDGKPRIAYSYAAQNGSTSPLEIRYAYRDGEAWQVETVATVPDSDGFLGLSLALDPADRPHVAYFDEGKGAIEYAGKNGSAWRHVQVASVVSAVLGQRALAIDSSGVPHLAFDDRSIASVIYAYLSLDRRTYFPVVR